MRDPDDIIKACVELRKIASNASECNEFVIAVAAKFGVTLSGNADHIMAEITELPWTQYGNNGKEASAAAENGALVIGGMTSEALGDAHGHVVVVVKGELGRDKYPVAYWGSENQHIRPDGALGKTVNFSFSVADRDNVVYASRDI